MSATQRTWRLDRMQALLDGHDHPEAAPLSVHVAGSKGKGSTAAFLASVLTAAGHSTGLYTSPHLRDWRERITRNGRPFRPEAYAAAVGRARSWWEALGREGQNRFARAWGGPPTTFEWLTLTAHLMFRDEAVQARVLETGLGGRLDATNAQTPSACVLTLIEREHTEILGDTLTLIAGEKAGILKPGVPAFSAPQDPEARAAFTSRAAERGSPLRFFDDEVEHLETGLSWEGTDLRLRWRGGPDLRVRLGLLGRAQALNAAVAAWTFAALADSGRVRLPPGSSLSAVLGTGLAATRLAGRFEVAGRDPWLVVDGAHTAASAASLAASWSELAGPGGTLVFGAFEGKALGAMARALAPRFAKVLVTRPGTFRPSNLEQMAAAFKEAGLPESAVESHEEAGVALARARSLGRPVLVCGSFYLVGEILTKLSSSAS